MFWKLPIESSECKVRYCDGQYYGETLKISSLSYVSLSGPSYCITPSGFYELRWTWNEFIVSESLQFCSNWGTGTLLSVAAYQSNCLCRKKCSAAEINVKSPHLILFIVFLYHLKQRISYHTMWSFVEKLCDRCSQACH